jgi:IS5 family transposase
MHQTYEGNRHDSKKFPEIIAKLADRFLTFSKNVDKVTLVFDKGNNLDLSKEGEVVYRDRGYHGAEPKAYSATMKRGARDHPLGIMDRLRNTIISKKRAPGERQYAVIKSVFHAGHVMVTTVKRVNVKMIFTGIGYNSYQLFTRKKQRAV